MQSVLAGLSGQSLCGNLSAASVSYWLSGDSCSTLRSLVYFELLQEAAEHTRSL